jgi:hypothetical protein
MTVLATTTASIGQPSHGMNGRCIVATSTTHPTRRSTCIDTITG